MEEISYAGSRTPSKKRLSKRLVVFGSLFVLILILLGSAIYFITRDKSTDPNSSSSNSTPNQEITSTPSPTIEISSTPEISETPVKSPSKSPSKTLSKTPSVSPSLTSAKSDLKVSVQNGSGVTGAAAKASDTLKAAGFNVVSTGNADTSDYTDVTIRIKNSQKSHLSAVEAALSKNYTVGSTTADLPEGTSYDVLVIIGQ